MPNSMLILLSAMGGSQIFYCLPVEQLTVVTHAQNRCESKYGKRPSSFGAVLPWMRIPFTFLEKAPHDQNTTYLD